MLRVLTAEIAPARGRVTLKGRAIAGQSPAALPHRRAVLPQQSALSFAFTAAEILGIGLDPLLRDEPVSSLGIAHRLAVMRLAGAGRWRSCTT